LQVSIAPLMKNCQQQSLASQHRLGLTVIVWTLHPYHSNNIFQLMDIQKFYLLQIFLLDELM